MKSNFISSTSLLILFLFFTACAPQKNPAAGNANMPNPASVFCEEHGGKVVILQTANGQAGICSFQDGSFCDEWAYFRGECKPGQSAPAKPDASATSGPAAPSRTQTASTNDWLVYTNDELGYRFSYPPGSTLAAADEPLNGLTISGPNVDGEPWPDIYIAHPPDREEYHPPEGVDLAQWLTDHNMLENERQPDVILSGKPAIHLRHIRSPQSYANDRYYFEHNGQLFLIVINHVGDREDWEVYNRFLDSFQFSSP